LVLKVCALPEHSRGAEWAAERINYMLSPSLWSVLNARMGPLLWYLMASDANVQAVAAGGSTLPHYTRWPAEGSSGMNVFSQTLTARPGLYANPVFGIPFSGTWPLPVPAVQGWQCVCRTFEVRPA
jgi:hypothetical protein